MEKDLNDASSDTVEGKGEGVSKIRVSKVIAGGIVTGVLLSAADFVIQNYVLAGEWQLVSQRLNIGAELIGGISIPALALMTAANILLGLTIMTTYAGMQPRFSAGPATAVLASFLIFLPCAVMLAGFGGWIIHWGLVFGQASMMLVTFIGAGSVGAWVLRRGHE